MGHTKLCDRVSCPAKNIWETLAVGRAHILLLTSIGDGKPEMNVTSGLTSASRSGRRFPANDAIGHFRRQDAVTFGRITGAAKGYKLLNTVQISAGAAPDVGNVFSDRVRARVCAVASISR